MKTPIPENMIIRVKEDKEVAMVGMLEAEMTFMKMQLKKENTEVVYAYPELVKSKEDLFLFAFTYGGHLTALQSGIRKVSSQVRDMFKDEIAQTSDGEGLKP